MALLAFFHLDKPPTRGQFPGCRFPATGAESVNTRALQGIYRVRPADLGNFPEGDFGGAWRIWVECRARLEREAHLPAFRNQTEIA